MKSRCSTRGYLSLARFDNRCILNSSCAKIVERALGVLKIILGNAGGSVILRERYPMGPAQSNGGASAGWYSFGIENT